MLFITICLNSYDYNTQQRVNFKDSWYVSFIDCRIFGEYETLCINMEKSWNTQLYVPGNFIWKLQ